VRLTYGYAQVINPIQGITSTEHINAAPAGTQAINGFTGYTGLSRHTRRTYLVTSENAERQQISQSRPIGLGPPRSEDVWANMARNLSRQPEKASSLDLRDRAQGLRRGAVSGFQRGLHAIERRQQDGLERTVLHHRVERRRLARRLSRMPEAAITLARRLTPSVDRIARVVPMAWDALGERLGYRQELRRGLHIRR
jgi:hypothetical protein